MSNCPIIIGIDSGYGNTKTAHFCFPTAVTAHDREPVFKMNLLVYNGRYYTIGEGYNARVHLAAGLPLTWVSVQKDSYRTYLLQSDTVDFNYRGVDCHIEFIGADIYPQGFSAVADKLREFQDVNMLCDIGNGAMNIMYINNRRPVAEKCFTEKYGTHRLRTHAPSAGTWLRSRSDAALRHGRRELPCAELWPIRSRACHHQQ